MRVPVTQGALDFPGFASLLILILCGTFVLVTSVRSVRSANIGVPVVLSVLASVGLLIVNTSLEPYLTNDQTTWHALGVGAADFLNGTSSQSVDYVAGKEGYIWLLGGLYAIAGNTPLVPIALNILFHALLVTTVAGTTEEVADSFQLDARAKARSVNAAALATAVLPSIVIWVPVILRESFSMFAVSAATLCMLRFVRSRRVWYLIAGAPFLISLYWVRESFALAVFFALCVGGVFVALQASKYSALLRIALVSAAVIAFPRILQILESTVGINEERVVTATAELSSIAASGFGGLGYNASLSEVLLTTAPRVLLGPFPWEFELSGVMLLAVMEGTIWLVVLALAAQAIVRGRRLTRPGGGPLDDLTASPILLIVAAVVLLALMLSIGNYGILARLRPNALVLMIPLAGVAVGLWRDRTHTGKGESGRERVHSGSTRERRVE
ncbi:hypothetical protein [Salinibacterium sp. SWN1162]|uniref:hypothetical protein n=1 Tax=Salinibacterium sp. SWN1162 TaxID=2792053 RepID=UPI0018CCFBE7|nr:hypothetical protein [Salinibacterium sp. SWN1162]MBH0008128.1 hypothetical protein [Salinibacterium sp. SWN1162]